MRGRLQRGGTGWLPPARDGAPEDSHSDRSAFVEERTGATARLPPGPAKSRRSRARLADLGRRVRPGRGFARLPERAAQLGGQAVRAVHNQWSDRAGSAKEHLFVRTEYAA